MSSETPPSVPGIPLFGNSHQVVRPLAFGERCRDLEAPLLRARAGTDSIYVVTDPSLIEEVLLTRTAAFEKPDMLRERLSASFGTPVEYDAASVATLREVWQPVMYADRLAEYAPAIRDALERALADLPADEPVDALALFRRLSLSIAASTLFGTDLEVDDREYGRLVDAISRKFAPSQIALSMAVPEWVPTPTNRRYRRAVADLGDLVDDVLERGDGPLLAGLERAREAGTLSAESVRTEIGILVVGAFEPLALALTYTCWALASDPPTQDRLRADVDAAYDRAATYGSLERVAYLDAVISESLRLYPPIYTMFRHTTRPADLGGCEIPAGARIWLSQWQLHRDERYVPDPLSFDPDRWLAEDSPPSNAYLPFGGGSRQCVGGAFATATIRVVVASLLRGYTLEAADTDAADLPVTAELSLVPAEPVELTLRPLE
ncbi:cytochrome P450 [Natronobiforma cellulositropha]|uniref:cytochrome P450 n=1 Tax=Natronobiforma cellulositropha TaxID=1679076 RepID=UPI0021D59CB5|nr:cytochrome P450 [Natronobiforma cellulositropha]